MSSEKLGLKETEKDSPGLTGDYLKLSQQTGAALHDFWGQLGLKRAQQGSLKKKAWCTKETS